MLNKIKVSILVPIYGVEKFIAQCAESLFNQTYQNIEYIFVNDCTKDNSIKVLYSIIDKYPSREKQIKIINHNINKGLVEARITALNNATAEYIIHVDSDDYLEVNAIELFVQELVRSNADIIWGNYANIYPDKKLNYIRKPETNIKQMAIDIIKRKQSCNIWNSLIKKSLYDSLTIPKINNGEDYVTMPRLVLRARKLSYVNSVTYNYTHLNESAFQFTPFSKKNMEDEKETIIFLTNYLKEQGVLTDFESALNTAMFIFNARQISHVYEKKKIKQLFLFELSYHLVDYEAIQWPYKLIVELFLKKMYSLIILINRSYFFIQKKHKF